MEDNKLSIAKEKLSMGNGFLTEDNGNYSSMRLMCMVSLANAIAISWYGILHIENMVSIFPTIIAFLSAAFAPKAIQKFAENPSLKDILKKKNATIPTQLP